MVVIPFSDFASFDQEVSLDLVPYRISFDYNVSYGFWTMTVKTRDLVVLAAGIKLVLYYDLFNQLPGRGLPPGRLFIVDTTDEIKKIDRDNIIDPLAIVYLEEAELDAI